LPKHVLVIDVGVQKIQPLLTRYTRPQRLLEILLQRLPCFSELVSPICDSQVFAQVAGDLTAVGQDFVPHFHVFFHPLAEKGELGEYRRVELRYCLVQFLLSLLVRRHIPSNALNRSDAPWTTVHPLQGPETIERGIAKRPILSIKASDVIDLDNYFLNARRSFELMTRNHVTRRAGPDHFDSVNVAENSAPRILPNTVRHEYLVSVNDRTAVRQFRNTPIRK